MGPVFWLRRFLLVFVGAAMVIAVAQVVQGHALADSIAHGLLWALLSTSVFIGARIFQSRRGQHCALCRDTPEMRDPPHPPRSP